MGERREIGSIKFRELPCSISAGEIIMEIRERENDNFRKKVPSSSIATTPSHRELFYLRAN